jgi:hypothetical protein
VRRRWWWRWWMWLVSHNSCRGFREGQLAWWELTAIMGPTRSIPVAKTAEQQSLPLNTSVVGIDVREDLCDTHAVR